MTFNLSILDFFAAES